MEEVGGGQGEDSEVKYITWGHSMGSTLSKEDGWREVQVRNLRSKIFLGDTQGEALCKEVGGGQVEDMWRSNKLLLES